MLIVTTNEAPGSEIVEVLGQVFGIVVRSRGLGGNIIAGLRSLVGGEIHEYTQMLEEARRHAIDRLSENAALMGANAVVGMRFDSAEIAETMSEIVAYGTAVRIRPLAGRAEAPAGEAAGGGVGTAGGELRTPPCSVTSFWPGASFSRLSGWSRPCWPAPRA